MNPNEKGPRIRDLYKRIIRANDVLRDAHSPEAVQLVQDLTKILEDARTRLGDRFDLNLGEVDYFTRRLNELFVSVCEDDFAA